MAKRNAPQRDATSPPDRNAGTTRREANDRKRKTLPPPEEAEGSSSAPHRNHKPDTKVKAKKQRLGDPEPTDRSTPALIESQRPSSLHGSPHHASNLHSDPKQYPTAGNHATIESARPQTGTIDPTELSLPQSQDLLQVEFNAEMVSTPTTATFQGFDPIFGHVLTNSRGLHDNSIALKDKVIMQRLHGRTDAAIGIEKADFISDLEIEKEALERVIDYSYRVGDHLAGGTKDNFRLLPEPSFDPWKKIGTELVDREFERDLLKERQGLYPQYQTKKFVIHGLFIVFEKLGLIDPKAFDIRTILIDNVPNGCPAKRAFEFDTAVLEKDKSNFLAACNHKVEFEKAVLDMLERNILLRHAVWVLVIRLMSGLVGDYYSHPDLVCNIGGVCQTLDLLIRKALDEASEDDKLAAHTHWKSVCVTWARHRKEMNLPPFKTKSNTLDGTSLFRDDQIKSGITNSAFQRPRGGLKTPSAVENCATPTSQLFQPLAVKTERPQLLSLSTGSLDKEVPPLTASRKQDEKSTMDFNDHRRGIQGGSPGQPWHQPEFQQYNEQQNENVHQEAHDFYPAATHHNSYHQQAGLFPQPTHQPTAPMPSYQQQSSPYPSSLLPKAVQQSHSSTPGVIPPPINSPFAYGNPWAGPNPYAEAGMYVLPNPNRPKSKLEAQTAPSRTNTPGSFTSTSNTASQPQQSRPPTAFQAPSRSRRHRKPVGTGSQEPVNRHLTNVGASLPQAGSSGARRSHSFAPSNPSPLNQVQAPAQSFRASSAVPATQNRPYLNTRSSTAPNVSTANPASFYQVPQAPPPSRNSGFAHNTSLQPSFQSHANRGSTASPYDEHKHFEAPTIEYTGQSGLSQSPINFLDPWGSDQAGAFSTAAPRTASTSSQSPFGSTRTSSMPGMTMPQDTSYPLPAVPHASTYPSTPVHQITRQPGSGATHSQSLNVNPSEIFTNSWVSPTAPGSLHDQAHNQSQQQGLGSPIRSFESDTNVGFLNELSFEEMISMTKEQIEAKRRSYSQRSSPASGSEGPVRKKSRTGRQG